MEFYLVDDLECDLVVFHSYLTLLALCEKEVGALPSLDAEAGEVDVVWTMVHDIGNWRRKTGNS